MRAVRRLALAGTLIGTTAAGLALWVPAGDNPDTEAAGASPAVSEPASGTTTVSATRTRRDTETLPSHQGTAVDGAVRLDADGQVITDRQLRRLFEYFLTGLGKASPEALKARMRAALEGRDLPPEAVAQVMALFDQYLGYRRALGELDRPGGSATSLRQAFEARYQLRREIFGAAAADGLFGREEAVDRYALKKRELMDNEQLTPEQRQRRLELLEQQLPREVREARQRTRVAVELRERTQALRESGADAARIHALREEMVGTAAARRLAELESRRSEWRQRLQAYREERQQIANSPGLAPEDKEAALDNLLDERFDEHERRRVRALERINADGE